MIGGRFTLDLFKAEKSANGRIIVLQVAGWFHNPALEVAPDIRVLINGNESGKLEFHLNRPDVEEVYGKLSYFPGFDQKIFAPVQSQFISFLYQGKELKSRKIFLNQAEKIIEGAKKVVFKLYKGQTNFTTPGLVIKNLKGTRVKSFKKETQPLTIDLQNLKPEICILPNSEAWIDLNIITPRVEKLIKNEVLNFKYTPKISILLPVYNGQKEWLEKAIQSVYNQYYTNWELCIADDASTKNETITFLRNLEISPKIKIQWRKTNGKIAEATNTAADLASGDFVLFLDQDDMLEPNTLFEIARCLQTKPDLDLIYADEDKITATGIHYDHHFKPEYSHSLLLGFNYITHPTCIRREIFEKAGRLRNGFNCAQDYDLILRVIELTSKIAHIPKILYHWRAIPGSMAFITSEKSEVFLSTEKVIKQHLIRNNKELEIYQPEFAKSRNLPIYQLIKPDSRDEVEIVIFTARNYSRTRHCLSSILEKTIYSNYSILVVDENDDQQAFANFSQSMRCPGINVVNVTKPSINSFSSRANLASAISKSPYILFLSNDTEIIEPEWLNRMMAYADVDDTGAVGARIISPDNRIIHAGKSLHTGIFSIPTNNFTNADSQEVSSFFQAETSSEKIAVSRDCLLTKHSLLHAIGGFDEKVFPDDFSDIDYCIRLKEFGFKTIYCAGAEIRQEMKDSNFSENYYKELYSFRKKYKSHPDPFLNENLDPNDFFRPGLFSTLDYRSLLNRPLKLIIFTHNFNWEGAPKVVYNLAFGLLKHRSFEILMVSPFDGPARKSLESQGIRTIAFTDQVLLQHKVQDSCDDIDTQKNIFKIILAEEKPDLVFVNVLHSFYIVNAVFECQVPVIWMVHESFTLQEIPYHIPWFNAENFEKAFRQAAFIVFCSGATAELYNTLDFRKRFRVIRNSLDSKYNQLTVNQEVKQIWRSRLHIPENTFVIVNVGIISPHKNQELLVEAAKILKDENILIYLVGARYSTPYLLILERLIVEYGLQNIVKIVPETPETDQYYLAADIFAFTSSNESYPLVILEAMAYGLPIITTPVNGVKEQVKFNVNALSINTNDASLLASQVKLLQHNSLLRNTLGQNSRIIFESMDTLDDMITAHSRLLTTAWQLFDPVYSAS